MAVIAMENNAKPMRKDELMAEIRKRKQENGDAGCMDIVSDTGFTREAAACCIRYHPSVRMVVK
ncbi:MAG TPA: hypothetical protein O0X27_05910 [Methanocorpusculum sp.]|nr:hypothetical protein [Methanocorpusculum sp.]